MSLNRDAVFHLRLGPWDTLSKHYGIIAPPRSLYKDDEEWMNANKFWIFPKISFSKISNTEDERMAIISKIISKYRETYPNSKMNVSQLQMSLFIRENNECAYYVWYDDKSHLFSGVIGLCGYSEKTYALQLGAKTIRLNKDKMIEISLTLKRRYERHVNRTANVWAPWILAQRPGNGWQYYENAKCAQCKKYKSKTIRLKLCKGCKRARYCSRHCQKIDWKCVHRKYCKPA